MPASRCDAAREPARSDRPDEAALRGRPAARLGSAPGRPGGSGMIRFGRSKTSIGGSVTIATSCPARAAEDGLDRARHRSSRRRRRGRAPRTAAADGAPRAGAPPRRGSRAVPCSTARRRPRRGRPSPGPGSASRRRPASRRPGSCRPSRRRARRRAARPPAPAWSRPRVGPPRATMPRMPATGRADRDAGPRPDVADDARRTATRAGRRCRPSRPASGRASRRRTRRPAPCSSPRRGTADPAPAGLRHRPRVGISTSSSRGSRSRSAIGAPTHDRVAGRDQRPVARGEREDRVDRRRRSAGGPGRAGRRPSASRRRLAGRDRASATASSSSRRRSGPIGQPERDVAQVDEEPAESAGHVDREVAAACPEPDRVAELELGDGRACPGGRSTSARPPGIRSSLVAPVAPRGRPASRRSGPRAGRPA